MSGLTTGWNYLTSWFRRDRATEANGEVSPNANTQVARQVASRDKAIAQLQGAYEEVVGLMSNIQQHMQAQNDRSERLLQMMEGLPEALKSLPEAQRTQTRTLEAIQTHLADQSQNTANLTQAIQGLAQAADNHERSMSIIQQQLDASQQNGEQILSSFSSLSETMGKMSDSSQAGTAVLQRLADRSEKSDQHMRQLFSRNQRQITIMSTISWALAILALGVAGFVAFTVTQQSLALGPAGSTPATTTAVTPAGEPGGEPGGSSMAAASAGGAAATEAVTETAPAEPEPETLTAPAAELEPARDVDQPADLAAEDVDFRELMAQPVFGHITLGDLSHRLDATFGDAWPLDADALADAEAPSDD